MIAFRLACLSAAIAIAAGAFGAHAAQGLAVEWLKTGATYQLIHAVAAAVLPGRPRWLLLAGSAIFSFSLYALALGAPRWLGTVAPVGGLMMIGGWLWFAYLASSSRKAATSSSDTDLST